VNWTYGRIPDGGLATFIIDLGLGIFNQQLFLMLKAAPVTIELELVQSAADIVVPELGPDDTVSPNAGNYNFQLEDCRLLADTVTVTSDLYERYAQTLLSGVALPVPLVSYAVQYASIPPRTSDAQIIINRAFSRLKAIFLSFDGTLPLIRNVGQDPYINDAVNGTDRNPNVFTVVNRFVAPFPTVNENPHANGTNQFQWQLQLGGRTMPAYPCTGAEEAFYRLRQAGHMVRSGNLNIANLKSYMTHQFVTGINLERAPGTAAFTGLSTRAGESIVLMLKNLPALAAGTANSVAITGVYITLVYDAIMNIRAEGVELQM
jgi:hypothetical protein